MQKRQFGKNGPMVSAIGIGAMSFSDFYGATTDAASHNILSTALDLGIDHIDTSNVYGNGRSETVIGEFLKAQGKQAQGLFTIATKAGINRDDQNNRWFDNSPDYLGKAIDASLKRLGVEHIDLFYIHRRDQKIPIEDVVGTLKGFIDAGKIGGIGFSEIAPSSLIRASAVHPVMAVQSEYSLSTRYPELGLVQRCASLETALVAFSPVGRSLLTDRPLTPEKVAELDFVRINPRFMPPNLEANLAITEGFRQFASSMGVAASSLAIAWVLHQGEHIIPIPGTRSTEHLRELAAATEITITDDILVELDRILPVGWAHGDRYSDKQWNGPEKYS